MSDLPGLERHLATLGRVLLGYSGGVDSALLAVAGTRCLGPGRFLAVIGRSASYPAVQHQLALDTACRFGVPLLEIDTGEMADPRYLANPTNRCYFCKSELWDRLEGIRTARGFDFIIDGTNADDLGEHRPGLGAARERSIRSPLAELGWTKSSIREAARSLGIPVWDAPAAPCLSSRVAYGLGITPERLGQIEAGEAFLRALGIGGDLRVRHHDKHARLEVLPEQMERVRQSWSRIEPFFLGLGFETVGLDPRGYQRGGLLNSLPVLTG